MNQESPYTAILIPAYNAHQHLGTLLVSIDNYLTDIPIIILDDGSTPPLEIPSGLKNRIELLRRESNKGKGASLRTGLNYIFKNYAVMSVITMDADGQHHPRHLTEFVNAHQSCPQSLIIGYRQFNMKLMPLSRIISNFSSSRLLSKKLKMNIKDSQCGFRLIPRNLDHIPDLCRENGFQFETELLVKTVNSNHLVSFIPIDTIYNGSKSFINKFNDIIQFIKIFLS